MVPAATATKDKDIPKTRRGILENWGWKELALILVSAMLGGMPTYVTLVATSVDREEVEKIIADKVPWPKEKAGVHAMINANTRDISGITKGIEGLTKASQENTIAVKVLAQKVDALLRERG